MVYQYRRIRQYFYGNLSSPATISDTTISSTAFASLPTLYSTSQYLPLVLRDDALGVYEVVWVVAHSAASNNVTVERGKEASTARAWPSGSRFDCAPTIRDGVSVTSRSVLPTDPSVGSRHTLDDEGFTVVGTYDSGWQSDVGVAIPAEYGLRQAGTALPTTSPVIMRGGQPTLFTDGSGQMQITYTAPFPHATLHAVLTWVSGGGVVPFYNLGVVAGSHTAAGFKAYLFRVDTGAAAGSGVSTVFSYMATGY